MFSEEELIWFVYPILEFVILSILGYIFPHKGIARCFGIIAAIGMLTAVLSVLPGIIEIVRLTEIPILYISFYMIYAIGYAVGWRMKLENLKTLSL